jgi:hypothetical protein
MPEARTLSQGAVSSDTPLYMIAATKRAAAADSCSCHCNISTDQQPWWLLGPRSTAHGQRPLLDNDLCLHCHLANRRKAHFTRLRTRNINPWECIQ